MAKTLSQLLTDTRRFIGETDSTNTHFSDTVLTDWLNEAYRKFVTVRRHLPVTSEDYAVTGAAVSLASTTAKVDYAKIKNPDNGGKYTPLTIITFDELMERDPDYEDAATGLPRFLVPLSYTSARLYPPPSDSVIAQATPLRTHGLEVPSDLSDDNDTPSLRDVDQDALPFWPAYRAYSELNDAAKSTEFLTLWRSALKELGQDTSMAKSQNGFRWPGSGAYLGLPAGFSEGRDY